MQVRNPREPYDLIIVGAGTAGSIIAAHVAERGVRARDGEPLRIVMIEAGPYVKGPLTPGYGIPRRRSLFTNIDSSENGRFVWPWPESCKMVGGSTMHWANNAYILHDLDYVHWMNESGVDWSKDKFKGSVDEIIREFNISPLPDQVFTVGNRLFRDAAGSMGYQTRPIPAARHNCLFCGYCQGGDFCKYDSKANVLGYVQRAEQRGVELIPDAHVERVILEKKGDKGVARGVVFTQSDGVVRELRADKVLVSSGTYGTPVLLARSGYGPRQQLGDKTLVHSSALGQNLEIQPGYSPWGYYDFDIKDERGAGNNGDYFWPETPADGTNVVIIRSTGMSTPNYPHLAALNLFAPRFGRAHKEYMRTAIHRLGTVRGTILTPPTKGSINVMTGETIYPYSDPRNVKTLRWAAEIMHDLHKKMGARKIDDQVPNSFRGVHPTGTCRAGSDPKESVVDAHFRSHDVENLLICDGSVIPRAALGMKCIPVCSIAAFAARRIIADHFKRA
ncbi:MAG: GMC family oxidoreductase [Acidobacteria bacterium]|nr:GMC family oxidoreductase [Acidobacteriota bacterium]